MRVLLRLSACLTLAACQSPSDPNPNQINKNTSNSQDPPASVNISGSHSSGPEQPHVRFEDAQKNEIFIECIYKDKFLANYRIANSSISAFDGSSNSYIDYAIYGPDASSKLVWTGPQQNNRRGMSFSQTNDFFAIYVKVYTDSEKNMYLLRINRKTGDMSQTPYNFWGESNDVLDERYTNVIANCRPSQSMVRAVNMF